MPKGTTKEEVHIEFMCFFGQVMHATKLESKLDQHCKKLFKTKFPETVLVKSAKAKL